MSIRMKLMLSFVLEKRERICLVLVLILSFEDDLAVLCMGFRYLDSDCHQLLVMLVCLLNLILRYSVVFPGLYYYDYHLVTQFF